MADASRTQIYYGAESTWGTASTAAYTEFRFTGESLGQNTTYINSNEIRSDRQLTDVIRTDVNAAGAVNIELSYGAFDDIYEGLFASDFGANVNISSTAVTASSTAATFSGADFSSVTAGQFVKVGSTATDVDGYYRATASSTDTLTVEPAPADLSPTAAGLTFKGAFLKNGTTEKSFTLEKKFDDITRFITFAGMRVGSGSLSIVPGQIVTGSFDFLGKSGTASTAATAPSTTAAATNSIVNAVDNVKAVLEGGIATTLDVTEITMNVTNNLRSLQAVANLGSVEIGYGRVNVSGTFSAYFENETLYNKYLNDTETDIAFVVEDASGNALAFDFPRAKLSNGQVVATGNDTDVIAQFDFTAFRDATNDLTVGLTRISST